MILIVFAYFFLAFLSLFEGSVIEGFSVSVLLFPFYMCAAKTLEFLCIKDSLVLLVC